MQWKGILGSVPDPSLGALNGLEKDCVQEFLPGFDYLKLYSAKLAFWFF